MEKINTVLFDFDGTLMDTNEVILGSWQHTFKAFEGRERPAGEILKTFGEPLTTTIVKLLPNVNVEEAVDIYRSFQRDKFGKMIRLFPGMPELLAALQSQGYKLGIVTSRLTGTTMQGLEKYDIKKHFDAVVTFDDTKKHKPDPDPVFCALEKLGSTAEEAIMLGDSKFDVLCARNAGVKSVLVGWSLAASEEDRTGENAPDYIIESADELLAILKDV